MATKIVTKNSSTASAVPTASDLVQGELAVNVADKRLFTEDNAGAIVELGTNPSTIDINAGTIDGTAIGASSASTGAFTTLTASGEITANGGIALGDGDVATFGAGDDLQIYHDGSNSRIVDAGTGIMTIQASSQLGIYNADGTQVSAEFVNDGKVGLRFSGSEKLTTTSTGIDVTGVITTDGLTTSADINFGDNDKAVFGAGSDLQIYHTGTDSRLVDSGTGTFYIAGTDLVFLDGTLAERYADFTFGGAARLYYDNAVKLATTSTGIDVTGTATMDGLTVEGTASFNYNGNENLFLADTANTSRSSLQISGPTTFFNGNIDSASHGLFIWRSSNAYTERLRIDSSGNVGVGISSPISGYNNTSALDVSGPVVSRGAISAHATNAGVFQYNANETAIRSYGATAGSGNITFSTGGGGSADTERMRIDSSGNVGIGNTVASSMNAGANQLVVGSGSTGQGITLYSSTSTAGSIHFADGTSGSEAYRGQLVYNHSGDYMAMLTAATERMRIDSSGNLLVGTSSLVGFTSAGSLHIKAGGGGPYVINCQNKDTGGGASQIQFKDGSGDVCGAIISNATSNTTAYGTSSDYRLKENVSNITEAIEKLKLLQPKTYSFIADSQATLQDGFLAHELATVIPNAVCGEKDDENEDGSLKAQQVDYGLVTPLLTAALQEAITKIESLTARIAALEE